LEINQWLEFFTDTVLQAQVESMQLLHFLIAKSKMLTTFAGQLNERQEKALLRIFSEDLAGFKGGLSAENYIATPKTSRATATRDLQDLVQKGVLTKSGELRHTRYWLNLKV
jgi:Fic family protein